MAFSAAATTTGSAGVLVLDVTAMLDRLPAEVRAQVAWARAPTMRALRRLIDEPLTDDLVAEASIEAIAPFRTVSKTFLEFMAEHRHQLRASVLEDFRREEARLSEYVRDEDASDTLMWVTDFLKSIFEYFFTWVPPEAILALDMERFGAVSADPETRAMFKGQVPFMAALEASREPNHRERAIELIDIAFLELMNVRDRLRQHGLWLPAFPDETPEDRRQGALKYALRIRGTLTDSDWAALDHARLGNLR